MLLCHCAVGKFSGLRSTECTTCPPGQYVDEMGQWHCIPCPVGKYVPSGTNGTSCYVCPGGKYAPKETATLCEGCAAGSFTNTKVEASICTQCSKGQYSVVSSKAMCIDCPPGKYTGSDGLRDCIGCSAGKSSFAGESVCTDCQRGMFCPEAAAHYDAVASNLTSSYQENCTGTTTQVLCSRYGPERCQIV